MKELWISEGDEVFNLTPKGEEALLAALSSPPNPNIRVVSSVHPEWGNKK